MELLEVRRLLAANFAHISSTGTLLITGTSGDDSISLSLTGSQIQVALNNSVLSFAKSQVKRIYLDASGGHDFVVGDNAITLRTTMLGSDGDDSLTGDGGGNYLLGGNGNDRLQGLGGNDTLDGGTGADFMFGATGHNWVD
jgi:Ca2+-binding RTX toxin-like protein